MNKILIIDDDRELCALIKRSVQSENIEADFCNTGREGWLNFLKKDCPYHGSGTDKKMYYTV